MAPYSLEHSVDGSHDGRGCGDHDVPYVYGRLPRAACPFPFSTREFARLMVLRSQVQEGIACRDDGAALEE